jgi:hypothetical protein
MRTFRFSLLASLLIGGAILATGCSTESGPERELTVASRLHSQSSTEEAEALPDCSDLASAPSTKETPVIQQVEGSQTLYVLVVGDTAVCSGEFDEVASSQPASGGVVFNTDEWAGSNPMPGTES